jgi:ADP-ribose pyrophosphatase
MPIKPWKTLSTRPIYENPWIRVREDIAELPNGRTSLYSVVTVGQAVGVVPFVDADHVLLVRQYRYVFGESHRWEIPTGGVHEGEALEAAALRELQEEVGHTAGRLDWLSTCYTSKSVVHEVAHLYIGTDLSASSLPADDTEFLEIGVFPFGDVLEMVHSSEIRDAMSVIAILHAAQRRMSNR